MAPAHEQRLHQRYTLPAMYTAIEARTPHAGAYGWHGHAYNISQGGVQFELDHLLEPGAPIVMRLQLPCRNAHTLRLGAPPATLTVEALANVVWIEDAEDPPPYRTAAVFSRFLTPNGQALLQSHIEGGRFLEAA